MAEYNPQHPWNPLPKEPDGDLDTSTLFAAVGEALSTWEIMEGTLGQIFAGLCGSHEEAPVRAFGRVQSAGGRYDMLEEAFDCSSAKRFLAAYDFPRLLKDIRCFSARRNEIAHGHALTWEFNGTPKGAFWVPPSYNSKKHLSREQTARIEPADELFALPLVTGLYAYNSRQINYYRDEFIKLSNRAINAWGALFTGRIEHMTGGSPGGA
jgi:hypothetical protein